MKRILKTAAFVLVLVLGSSLRNDVSAQYRGDVSYQTFYDELSPHGQWVDYPSYGYVWVPNNNRGFRPYETNGHWVWTEDYEWMWVSDYDWGWAPFHYGRWFEDDYYGWVWVPGYEWSPAWVAWRDGGDYYGWAPLRPGINISINFNLGGYNPPHNYWCFVPRRYIASPGWYGHRVDYRRNVTIINQTTIINNYNYTQNVFRTGPRRSNVEVYTGRINPVRLRESNTPGRSVFRNNEVTVFRPQVRQDNNRQFAPRQVQRYEDRATAGRNSNSNGVFRRNGNNEVRTTDNSNANQRTNNLPRRQADRNTERSNDQQGSNRMERRRPAVDRTDNDRPQNNNERRVFRSQDQNSERRAQQGNTENRRVFERRADNPSREPQVRNQQAERQRPVMQQRESQPRQQRVEQPRQQRVEQPRQQRVEQPRRSESGNQRSGNNNGRGNRRF